VNDIILHDTLLFPRSLKYLCERLICQNITCRTIKGINSPTLGHGIFCWVISFASVIERSWLLWKLRESMESMSLLTKFKIQLEFMMLQIR